MDESFQVVAIAGRALNDGYALVKWTFNGNFHDDESVEWSLLRLNQNGIHSIMRGERNPQSLWVSPSGKIYVVGNINGTYGLHLGIPTQDGYEWEWQSPVQSDLTRPKAVWGIDDANVFAWGGGVLESAPTDPERKGRGIDTPYVWVFNGTSWKQYASPGQIFDLHGKDLECITIAGSEGLLAYWTNGQWEKDPFSFPQNLGFVQAKNRSEIYASSLEGRVFKKETLDWKELDPYLGHVYSFTFWKERLLVGTRQGFYGIEDDRLVLIHSSEVNVAYSTGETLIWVSDSDIRETTDFVSFSSIPLSDLATAAGYERL